MQTYVGTTRYRVSQTQCRAFCVM